MWCWAPPIPLKGETAPVVVLNVRFTIDGEIAEVPTPVSATDSADPIIEAATKSATRAVFTCAPYKLPREKFSLWENTTITFDPRYMFPNR